VAYENKNFGENRGGENRTGDTRNESIYSKRIKAGKRRTYFFDVRSTRGNDYFITITESKKRFDDNGYDRHKMFLYKEDFNKFLAGLTETIQYVKTDLMPDFDFDAFNHDQENEEGNAVASSENGEHNEVTGHTEATEAAEVEEVAEVAAVSSVTIGEGDSVDDWKI
jgi:hypothetical protein